MIFEHINIDNEAQYIARYLDISHATMKRGICNHCAMYDHNEMTCKRDITPKRFSICADGKFIYLEVIDDCRK